MDIFNSTIFYILVILGLGMIFIMCIFSLVELKKSFKLGIDNKK